MSNPVAAAQEGVAAVRRKRPFLDHLIRAYSRYQADAGDRLAAGVTYFGFLSFFPLVVLAFSITGFIVDAYPSAQESVVSAFNSFLPGLSDKLKIADIGNAKVATGVIGLVGLLWSGLGWVDALRDAVRTMWHQTTDAGNIAIKKVNDVRVLIGIGFTLLLSTVVTGAAAGAAGSVLRQVGLEGSSPAHVLLIGVGLLLGVAVDVLLFTYLFTRLPRLTTPFRRVLRGALFGAIGFEILKVVGSILVARAASNPVYGTFGIIVGLLIWINLVTRLTLFTAAWTVTAPYDTDVPPSGSAVPDEELPAEETAEIYPDESRPADTGTGGSSTVSVNGSTRGASGYGTASADRPSSDRVSRAAGAVGAGVIAVGTASFLLRGVRARHERRCGR